MFHLYRLLSAAFLLSVAAADAPAPVPVDRVLQSITLPPGFKATLFAGEPDLVQPIAMTTDTRGRLWVIECLSYPNWSTNKTGSDRVSIYEDTNHDGVFDKKTVFWDKGRNLSGIALGFGGVWLCSLPELIFIPDRDYNDKPDAEPEVLLDGWDLASKHNAFNDLTWGPDGWLYGCNGILGASFVGKPGTPQPQRVPMNCGVWRYHPTRRVFEVVAHGTTNPWGIAFNDVGQMFVANCVIKHLFHIIPGARYERMFGQDFNPYAFQLIPSIADHIHWAGGYWKTEGADNPQNDVAGGGHAHCGAMIYLGDNWPDQYRNTFFTINIHGHRLNHDLLVPQGSGYVGKHTNDFLRVDDTWFRGVSVIPAADGGVFMSDWCDAGECHDYEDIHRENGRVYKIVYGAAGKTYPDIRRVSDNELINFLSAKDEWLVNQARLVLAERADMRNLQPNTVVRLQDRFRRGENLHDRLRALWALQCMGEAASVRDDALVDSEEYVRAFAIQFATELKNPSAALVGQFADMAANDPSPVVRLYLSSALQRMKPADRVRVAAGVLAHADDASDPNLPLLTWYGIEPVVASDETAALKLLESAQIPLVRRFIAQRLSLRLALDGVSALLSQSRKPDLQADILHGMFAALNGRHDLKAPQDWSRAVSVLKAHPDPAVRDEATRLSLVFGDASALADLSARVSDPSVPAASRAAALESLAQARRPDVVPLLKRSVEDPQLRGIAIRALAAYDDPETPKLILDEYSKLKPQEKAEAINTLASRAGYSVALLEAVRDKKIPMRDITPFSVRQIQAYKDARLQPLLQELGTVRGVSNDKAAQIQKYKQLLTPAVLAQADLSHGRAMFQRTCASCHTLFDTGGTLAPELTGSQRSNLDYLLENIIDPNAVVWDRYKATYFETRDDRLISGVVVQENESTVSIQTQTGTITLPRNEIVTRNQSNLSMMPEGLFDTLDQREMIDLVGYLQSPNQVPLPTAANP
jgi:putative membrane-bound dehydrogenase-like protein